ncbi:MAG: sel1 repeat family protein [Erysipelotrichaceae bacterium]|nr:sel1 repeat family protein [Erysipelotrichaceae bacterium]
MTVDQVRERIEELIEQDPFGKKEDNAFELCELALHVYRRTGKTGYLDLADSTGYLNSPSYLLEEYLKAIDAGSKAYASKAARIYFEGGLGQPDYQKAFDYYSMAALIGKTGSGTFEDSYVEVSKDARYHLALMYRDGLYVEKDETKYRSLMENLRQEILDGQWYESDPEICMEIGDMLIREKDEEGAFELLIKARNDICFWILQFNASADKLTEINDRIYSIIPLDQYELGAADLSELVKRAGTISFSHDGEEYEIKAIDDKGRIVIEYLGEYYPDAGKLINSALIGEEPFHEAMFETSDWRFA